MRQAEAGTPAAGAERSDLLEVEEEIRPARIGELCELREDNAKLKLAFESPVRAAPANSDDRSHERVGLRGERDPRGLDASGGIEGTAVARTSCALSRCGHCFRAFDSAGVARIPASQH